MKKTRAFLALNISDEMKEEVGHLQERLPPFIGKTASKQNLHLTLKFLGEIDDTMLAKVKTCLKTVDTQSFDLSLGKVGVFSPSMVRILWVALEGAEELQRAIDTALEPCFKKEKQFMGHLTIGRVKRLKHKKTFLEALERLGVPSFSSKVSSFILYESILSPEGPTYRVLEEFPLK